MDQLIYSINLNGIKLQLEENNLGYCVTVNYGLHTDIFIYASLDESMTMMDYLMNQLDGRF